MPTSLQANVLVVDDDDEIRTLLQDFLKAHGFQVYTAADSNSFYTLLESNSDIDLILLDIMLPGADGIELCKTLRQTSQIPIIMLTALNTDSDRIISLELGADDYIAKPFNPRELLARIKAVLRRSKELLPATSHFKQQYPVFKFSGWILDTANHRLISPEQIEVAIGSSAYNILILFLEHPQRVLSRDQLLEMTKNRTSNAFDRSIDVQISRLRQKIEKNPKSPELIKTIRTGGYLFTPSVQRL